MNYPRTYYFVEILHRSQQKHAKNGKNFPLTKRSITQIKYEIIAYSIRNENVREKAHIHPCVLIS